MNILSIPSPNHFNGRAGNTPTFIILHGTAGFTTAQDVANYFATSASQVSSNYVIGQDGTVICCVPEDTAAWGNGVLESGHDPWWSASINPNFQTISIEHVKPASDNSNVLTDAQKAASFELIASICANWNIPARAADASGGITGHYSISPQTRARCPGIYPSDELWAYLQQGAQAMPTVPSGWQDDGTTLTDPGGIQTTLGFRDYIMNHTWDPENWAVQPAQGRDPLEISNPGLGKGTQQIFRTCVLEWTPSRGVFMSWVGVELLALRKLAAATPAANTKALQAQLNAQLAQIAHLTDQLAIYKQASPALVSMQASLQQIANLAQPFTKK